MELAVLAQSSKGPQLMAVVAFLSLVVLERYHLLQEVVRHVRHIPEDNPTDEPALVTRAGATKCCNTMEPA